MSTAFNVKVKPLSVNDAWKGRRYKTDAYKQYEQYLLWTLPKIDIPEPPYQIEIEFGVSKSFDIDNGVKPFLDILQKKFLFNDKDVYSLNLKKVIASKGFEFIRFSIDTCKMQKD
jgi:Holliday junction resolvase RusA-like endonuclease